MRSTKVFAMVGVVGLAGACLAVGMDPQAQVESPMTPLTAAQPKSQSAAAGKAPSFPEPVKKNLYATNDLRGKAAPAFEVEAWLTPEAVRKDKVVLIDFWATWCPPCRALIPELNEWAKEFKDDLVVIGVSDEPEAKVRPFMTKTKVEYSMAVDTKAKMKGSIGVKGIPHVVVVDSKGVVRWQGFPQSGEEKLTKELLKRIIEADKAQRAPASPVDPKPAAAAPESPKK